MLLRDLIYLNEAKRSKSSDDRTNTVDLDDFDSKLNDLFKSRMQYNLEPKKPTPNVNLTRATAQRTSQAVGDIRLDDVSAAHLSSLDQSGLEDEKVQRPDVANFDPKPPKPSNSIKLRSTEVSTKQREPMWHKVENLPGYMKSAIRAMGRKVFAPFTTTDIENIDVLANLNGSGPNTDEELRQVGVYLKRNGKRNTTAEMKFTDIMPGYQADIQVWLAGDREYMTVKDHAGHYIYSWPSKDSKFFGGGTQLSNDTSIGDTGKRLR